MDNNTKGKDLTKQAPRSPKVELGGYVILGRTLDKCRALVNGGDIGEYHFDCPLDNMLFGWKGVTGDDFKAEVEKGTDDAGMVKWMDAHGTPKTDEEKAAWRKEMLQTNPYNNPEKREWYEDAVKPLGLDASQTPLFDWLEKDDKASYATATA